MVGDEADLYRRLAPRVHAVVRRQINGSEELVEDACHTAWVKFIERSEQIGRQGTLTWLVRTAIRDAYKLSHREHRDLSLDGPKAVLDQPSAGTKPDPVKHAEHRERLALTKQLRERQQRLLWLQAIGLSYTEIAAATGDSLRTVERQLLRAQAQLQQLDKRPQAASPIQPTGPLSMPTLGQPRLGRNTQPKRLQRP
jgi:RNA polymerase sigma factor (sigma-70 family)